MGVQDFKKEVLEIVRREVPTIPVSELCSLVRSNSMSLNLDLIYGLPSQSASSFEDTIQQAIECQPDRLVTFSYAHVPWVKPAQNKLEEYGLPEPDEKVKMFEIAWASMLSAGYIPIGLDHYARPEDNLAKAVENKTLHRNFQGYCTRDTTGQVYAFGVTGISQLESAYAQNTYQVNEYVDCMKQRELKIVKGYVLNIVEKIVRDVINEIMCNHYLLWKQIANRFNMSVTEIKDILNFQESKLSVFENDKLLNCTEDEIIIHPVGRFFLRNIAAVFDIHINTGKQYSKSV